MVKLNWKRDVKLNTEAARGLPKQRGSAVVFFNADTVPPLPRYPKGYCGHFSWDGQSFRLRNFLAGQTAQQDGTISATEVYEAGRFQRPCIGDLHVPYIDADFWKGTLIKMTEEIYAQEGWKLGKEE
jgi:hypothetical protein